jgi:hypothetical protein
MKGWLQAARRHTPLVRESPHPAPIGRQLLQAGLLLGCRHREQEECQPQGCRAVQELILLDER